MAKRKKTSKKATEGDTSKRLPVVSIIGRPNVGKSSLFNILCGSRIAIEDPRPGTTRDRVSFELKIRGTKSEIGFAGKDRRVELVDAAGVGVVDEADIEPHVEEQLQFAIDAADVLLFVTDAKAGLLPIDAQIAARLRKVDKPVVLAVNKTDAYHHDVRAEEFRRLGLGEPIPVSAKEQRGLRELRGAIVKALPPKVDAERNLPPPEMKLAIVGKRNSGKSSLVNFLARDERVIVSEIPGTTRDSIDVRFRYKDREFVAIDTAGLQRRQGVKNSVDFFGQARSVKAIRRADVVIILMDCLEQASRLDRKLADEAIDNVKPVIIAVNKWDLAGKVTTDKYQKYIEARLPSLSYAPIVFLSVKNGTNCTELIDLALDLHKQTNLRVGTGELNRAVHEAFELQRPHARMGKQPKLFYATQVEVNPPTILVYVNDAQNFPSSWREYLKHRLREKLPFGEIPLKVIFKNRERVELEKI
ncbi:MAG: ribosome biogenesis GTPase Der [Planctomycetes bacterium]|nr:ribosome biogenesis GTPase Der [Planctomycetota bacterium]NUQ33490.1 ribosome biogenesis GTPase Der [Planctomycetaceae bacterium]